MVIRIRLKVIVWPHGFEPDFKLENAPYIQSLVKLIKTQSKTTLAHWAVDFP